MKQCVINEYITIKLEEVTVEDFRIGPGGKDYVAGYYYEECNSIYLNGKWYSSYDPDKYDSMCKDIQHWYTSNYDCSLLPPEFAFKLLRKLIEYKDPLAIKVGDKEILRGLREQKIGEEYRNLLARNSFWESLEIDSSVLQNLEKIIKKEFKSGHSPDIRNPYVGFVIKENKVVSLHLDDCALKVVPDQISQLEYLEYLSLRNNQIKFLPDFFKDLKNLQSLDLSYNKLEEFPSVLFKMTSLERLELYVNEIEEIPEEIINLTNLRNFSYGEKSKKFPEVLCHMKHIEIISVSSPIELLPPSFQFLNFGRSHRGRSNQRRPNLLRNSDATRYAWDQFFERNKILCCKCERKYHTNNFPMCYDCLIKHEGKFRANPLEYTRNLKWFDLNDWIKNKEEEKILQEEIEKSINTKGIFSYPKEVQSLVLDLKKEASGFTEYKDPYFLPLFYKAVFETDDKYRLIDFKMKHFPKSVEDHLKKLFNGAMSSNLWKGTFFQDIYFEEMKRKVSQNYLPKINKSLQQWLDKYILKRKIKASVPDLNKKFSGFCDTFKGLIIIFSQTEGEHKYTEYRFDAKYGVFDNLTIVSCNFTYSGPEKNAASEVYPSKIVSTEAIHDQIESKEYPGLIIPVHNVKTILFISDIRSDEKLSSEDKESRITEEIQKLTEFIINPRFIKRWNYKSRIYKRVNLLSLDDLPDEIFIRIILFEENYQKEYMYSIISRFSSLYKKKLDEEMLKLINEVVPSRLQEKLVEGLRENDVRLKSKFSCLVF